MAQPLRLAELLASLSLATDLGTGQPLGHGLSTSLLSVDLARAMGCDRDEVRAVHHVALLRFLGCTSDAAESARQVGGDEISFNAAMAPVLFGGPTEMIPAMLRAVGRGAPPLHRARLAGAALADVGGAQRSLAAHCEVAAMLGRRLHVAGAVVDALGHAFERWDGKGYPGGVAGDDIPRPVRIAQVARDADLFHRAGADAAALLRNRRGKAYDPEVVDTYFELGSVRREAQWEEVLAAEPEPAAVVDDVDEALRVVADFVDLKSPFTRGHSPRVADLAASAVGAMGFGADTCATVRRAGLVHDVGRVGVENGIWDKPGPLSTDEWEKVRLHPYHTERVLTRCPALRSVTELAAAHHERLDGSGYHRRLGADGLSYPARVLAAADVFVALTADRPHRTRLDTDRASAVLEDEAKAGHLDGEAVAWVLAAARGDREPPQVVNPGGLTDREVEVLTLIAAGNTNKEAAGQLGISAKTVGRHVENIYTKIDVSTRAGATVYAMEHRLLG